MSRHEYLTDFIVAFVCRNWEETAQAIYWLDRYEAEAAAALVACAMPDLWQWDWDEPEEAVI